MMSDILITANNISKIYDQDILLVLWGQVVPENQHY